MEILIAFLISLLTQFVKKFIKPKFGDLGVQALVLLLSIVVAFGYYFYGVNESFKQFVVQALQILTVSITIYEVILKRLYAALMKNDTI